MSVLLIGNLIIVTTSGAVIMRLPVNGKSGMRRDCPMPKDVLVAMGYTGPSSAPIIEGTRLATKPNLSMMVASNTVRPVGKVWLAVDLRRSFTVTLLALILVTRIEILVMGTPRGPPPLATHFCVLTLVSAIAKRGQSVLWSTPTLVAKHAAEGMTYGAIARGRIRAGSRRRREGDRRTRRARRLQSGWSRRNGSTCQRLASWVA